jgi:hypothetical protein
MELYLVCKDAAAPISWIMKGCTPSEDDAVPWITHTHTHTLSLSLSLSLSWVVPPHSPNNNKNSQLFFVPSPFSLVGNLLQPKSAIRQQKIMRSSSCLLQYSPSPKKRIEPTRGTSNSNRSRCSLPKWEKKKKKN